MERGAFDRSAAHALLVGRGMSRLQANEFLMRSLLTSAEAATVLGVKHTRAAARATLRRWGVKPMGHSAGHHGPNRYPAALVWYHLQNRPDRGGREHSGAPEATRSTDPDHRAAQPAESQIQPGAHAGTFSKPTDDYPWYLDHDDIVGLAAALVDSDWLLTAHDVVTFFAAPWKWGDMFQIWADAGRPHPPSSSDRAQARQLGPGTMRHQLDRQYADDKARWESLVAAFEGRIAGEELSPDSSIPPSGRIADVIALKDVAPQRRT